MTIFTLIILFLWIFDPDWVLVTPYIGVIGNFTWQNARITKKI